MLHLWILHRVLPVCISYVSTVLWRKKGEQKNTRLSPVSLRFFLRKEVYIDNYLIYIHKNTLLLQIQTGRNLFFSEKLEKKKRMKNRPRGGQGLGPFQGRKPLLTHVEDTTK